MGPETTACREEAAQELLRRAWDHQRAGRFAAAVADLDVVLELTSGESIARIRRGLCHLALGDLKRALADCESGVGLSGGDPVALHARGLVFQEMGDRIRALADFDAAIAAGPPTAAFHHSRGVGRLSCGDLPGALADALRARRLAPAGSPVYTLLGLIYLRLGWAGPAQANLRRALILDPEGVEPRLHLATLASSRRDPASSLGLISEVLAARTEGEHTVLALALRARILMRLGLFADARRDCEEIITLRPGSALGYYARGTVRAAAGGTAAAVADLTRALELDPGLAGAYVNRALAWEHVQRGDAGRSLADLRRAVSRSETAFRDLWSFHLRRLDWRALPAAARWGAAAAWRVWLRLGTAVQALVVVGRDWAAVSLGRRGQQGAADGR